MQPQEVVALAQPQPEGMPDRLRARLASDAQGLPEPFDATDAVHVDQAAAALLKRFFAENDPKCFELLVELTLPILNGATEDVSREEGLAAGAQTLLTPIFSQIFVSLRPPAGLLDAPFLGWMVGQAREGARQRVAALAARKIPIAETDGIVSATPGEPREPRQSGGPVEPQPGTVLARLTAAVASSAAPDLTPLGLSLSGIVEIVYHRLAVEHRRILRCVEVAQMSDVNAALFLNIPEAEVQDRTAAARGELQAGVRAVLDKLSESLTCALKGTDLSTVSAEHLAEHLVSCDTCTGNVELMHSLGDVPGWLKSVENSPGDASRVEQVLASANGRGTDELSRLLYEMFRACMKNVEGFAQSRRFVSDPDSRQSLSERVEQANRRLRANTPGTSEVNPLRAARACVGMLEQVSSHARVRFAQGSLAFAEGRLEDACERFESVADDSTSSDEARTHALLNLLEPLELLNRDNEFLEISSKLLDTGRFPRHVQWHLAVFHAWRKDAKAWSSAACSFSQTDVGADEMTYWQGMIESHAPAMAKALELPLQDVLSALRGRPNEETQR